MDNTFFLAGLVCRVRLPHWSLVEPTPGLGRWVADVWCKPGQVWLAQSHWRRQWESFAPMIHLRILRFPVAAQSSSQCHLAISLRRPTLAELRANHNSLCGWLSVTEGHANTDKHTHTHTHTCVHKKNAPLYVRLVSKATSMGMNG